MNARFSWLWDTDLDNAAFESILSGRKTQPPHDGHWAMLRLIEYAPYVEIRRLLPREQFLQAWPELAPRVRSRMRREGMDFLFQWLHAKAGQHA
jgi:hypothetical protein